MWVQSLPNELYHHGILGMHWHHHKIHSEPTFYKESSKKIQINKDGSKTIPSGFVLNRVGKAKMDINQSGAIYCSYGKRDAARYIKTLGPTLIGKLLGTSGEAVQHISTVGSLKVPSDSQTASETAKVLLSNKKLFKSFQESIYSASFKKDLSKDVSVNDKKMLSPILVGKMAKYWHIQLVLF